MGHCFRDTQYKGKFLSTIHCTFCTLPARRRRSFWGQFSYQQPYLPYPRQSGSPEYRRISLALVILEGPIDLLDVGKDDLGVEPARADHVVHVVAGDKVGDARQPLSGLEGKLVVGLPVARAQLGEVKRLREKVVNEGTEGQTVGPAGGEVVDLDIIVLPGSALAPDEDGLHLGGHHLRSASVGSGDTEFKGDTGVSGHASTLAVRVEAGGGGLAFLNKSGHVLEEEIVHVLLVHVLQLDGGTGLLSASHGGWMWLLLRQNRFNLL